jgi:hypothetical protein
MSVGYSKTERRKSLNLLYTAQKYADQGIPLKIQAIPLLEENVGFIYKQQASPSPCDLEHHF